MSGRRTLRLGLAAYGTGWDLDAWRLPEATSSGLRDPSVILDTARTAERGKLDYVFAGSALGSEPDRLNRIFRWDNFVYAGHAAAITKNRARDVKNGGELLGRILTTQIGEDATLRDLYHYVQRSRHEQQPAVVGDARAIADWLEENFEEEVLDGVQLFPPYHRGPADLFVDLVVPELRRRGIFRTEYEASTLQGLLDTDDV